MHHLQRVGADREQGGVEGGVDDGEARLAQGGDAAHAAQRLRQRVDDGVAPHVVQHRYELEPVESVPVGLVSHAARALPQGEEPGAQAAHAEQHVHEQAPLPRTHDFPQWRPQAIWQTDPSGLAGHSIPAGDAAAAGFEAA